MTELKWASNNLEIGINSPTAGKEFWYQNPSTTTPTEYTYKGRPIVKIEHSAAIVYTDNYYFSFILRRRFLENNDSDNLSNSEKKLAERMMKTYKELTIKNSANNSSKLGIIYTIFPSLGFFDSPQYGFSLYYPTDFSDSKVRDKYTSYGITTELLTILNKNDTSLRLEVINNPDNISLYDIFDNALRQCMQEQEIEHGPGCPIPQPDNWEKRTINGYVMLIGEEPISSIGAYIIKPGYIIHIQYTAHDGLSIAPVFEDVLKSIEIKK